MCLFTHFFLFALTTEVLVGFMSVDCLRFSPDGCGDWWLVLNFESIVLDVGDCFLSGLLCALVGDLGYG